MYMLPFEKEKVEILKKQKDKITILVNRWDSRITCQDKEIIKSIFNNFGTTDNLSTDL